MPLDQKTIQRPSCVRVKAPLSLLCSKITTSINQEINSDEGPSNSDPGSVMRGLYYERRLGRKSV